MKKVVLTHRLHEEGMKVLAGEVDVKITNTGNPQEMLPELIDADGLIIRIGSIDRKTILAAKNLKVIGRPGVGVDDVDIATATELGIPVVIAPGANTRSVAEHAFMLMMAAAKDLLNSDFETRKGNFAVRNTYRAFEFLGKTLGLVGYGSIGRELAKLSTAIGMKVIVYDPFVDPVAIEEQGYQYKKELEQLLGAADVVSLHIPLTDKTRGLIGKREFGLMKTGAILINCARGGIVDEEALAEALLNNKLHSAAADVFSSEPVKSDHPLLNLKNMIITPHMGGLTREAASKVATMAAEGVLAIVNGEQWPYVANPEVYKHPKWQKNKGGEQ
ncbi:d-isomer specific 2-hydroxyacid dehydrogenases signature 3 [Lucifera butyrica]|uniref:D-isomer specific 2-hydroxyacid dehydrogenases signature 3 n=1 Tax=Lucifera butyrica TaxID=1351585 RepID=A0A498R841_9FIRM|nr:hydroxyacid dehydrogenase [Lucifera butyrica]VBB07684.1 d-isomer specific 2-hydroxyacid dehydrogenases signature 3 [Lucifera butyrica]